MGWLIPFSSLTPEQQTAAMMPTDRHRVITGGPGSGKTLVLVHRFGYLYQRAGGRHDKGRLFVFTTTLKDFVRAALPDTGVPEDMVTTFDKWCADVYRAHVDKKVPYQQVGKRSQPDFATIRRAVHEAVVKRGVQRGTHDFVVVDEGQDLTLEAIEILAAISKHVTVAMDGKQQLYDEGAAELGLLKALGLTRQNVSLIAGFRCNPMVTALAAHFLSDHRQREEFKLQGRNASGDRQKPLLLVAPDWQAERDHLAELMRLRFSLGESVGVLLPQRRLVYGYAKGFRELGIDVLTDSREGIQFGDPRPKVLTFHEAKGLTFDSVFMPRLDNGAFNEHLLRRQLPLMFVGVSRAVKWACLSTLSERMVPPIAAIVSGNALDYVEIKRITATTQLTASQSEEDDLPF